MTEVELAGGVANAGAVVRVGDHVLRPSNRHTPTIHRFLRSIHQAGFDGASVPTGVDPDGRERLWFIEGDVAIPPYPQWVQADEAMASLARLMRRFHDASSAFVPREDDTWSDEMADPDGGPIVCHNDVCLENVVFRDGEAVGLLDFDFAAPGKPIYDLACCARMCVGINAPENRTRTGFRPAELPTRLRRFSDAYGLDAAGRGALVEELDRAVARGGAFVQRRLDAGEPAFIAMVEQMGGMAFYDRRREWWAATRADFDEAMV